jgi:hypothetical protein
MRLERVEGPPPSGDPQKQLLIAAAIAELLALTSSSPAVAMATGLLAWIIRYLLELRA